MQQQQHQQVSQFNEEEEQEDLFQIARQTICLITNYSLISALEAEIFLQKRAILEDLYCSQQQQQRQDNHKEKQPSTNNQQQLSFKKATNFCDSKLEVNQLSNKLAGILSGRNVERQLMEQSNRNVSGFSSQNRQIKVERNNRENYDEDEEQKGGSEAQRNEHQDNNDNLDHGNQNHGQLGGQQYYQNVKSEAITRADGGQEDNLEIEELQQQDEQFTSSQDIRIVDPLVINSSHSQSDYGISENEPIISEQLEDNNKYKKYKIKTEENVVDNFNQNFQQENLEGIHNQAQQESNQIQLPDIQRQTENIEESSNIYGLSSPNSKSQKSSLKRCRSQSQEREDHEIEPPSKRLKSIKNILEEQQKIFKLLAAEKNIFESSKCKSVTSDALVLKEEFVEEETKDSKDILKAFVGCLKQSKLPSSYAGFFFLRGPNNLKVDCLFPNGKIEKACEKEALIEAIAEARKIDKISTLHIYMDGSSCEELKECQKVGEYDKIQFHKCSFSRISSC